MADYQPVSCQIHSEYELAILRRTRLQLEWRHEAGKTIRQTVLPVDILTKNGAEFLKIKTLDHKHNQKQNQEKEFVEIRLDQILLRKIV